MEQEYELPEEYRPLLKSLCKAAVRKSEAIYTKHEETPFSDKTHYENFVIPLYKNLADEEKINFFAELAQQKISSSELYKEQQDGFPGTRQVKLTAEERAEKAFYLAVKYNMIKRRIEPVDLLIEILKRARDGITGRIRLNGISGHEKEIEHLLQTSPKGPTTYIKEILSEHHFSEGLRDSIKRFNEELIFLTIEQIRALEASMNHRHLWVEGAAGTGKTIFAIEAAYRALRAGLSVLITYRSRQFEKIFSNLLKNAGGQLTLMLHTEFVLLLFQADKFGIESQTFKNTAAEILPNIEFKTKPIFDLLIMDDGGAYDTRMPVLLKHTNELAYRKIFLVAPEQTLDNIFELATGRERTSGESYELLSQKLTAPPDYFKVSLNKNIRNSGGIVEYVNQVCELTHSAGIIEAGKVSVVNTSWAELEKTLLSLCAELLEHFPPERIKVLVDPNINYPPLEYLNPDKYVEGFGNAFEQLPTLAGAIIFASSNGHFLTATFDCSTRHINEVFSMKANSKVCFICTDGYEMHALAEGALEYIANTSVFMTSMEQWSSPHIDATAALSYDALCDPLKLAGAILIYPVPIFIGLESDVVIYVRDQSDFFEQKLSSDINVTEKLEITRKSHHFLAMSRAKHHLIDLKII